MDYSAMMHGIPQMGLQYEMVPHASDLSRPRQAYSYPYSSDSVFLMPQIPPPPHHHRTMAEHQSMVHAKQTEPKPRLAKDEVQLLENEFQKNPKPSSQRKREIADLLKVDNPRINNWFQNRRAKAKQMLRREADPRAAGDESPSESSPSDHQDDSLVSEYYGSNQQSLPLRASSATFPAMEQPPLSIYTGATDGSSHGTSPSGDEYSSPGSHDMAYAMNGFLGATATVPEYYVPKYEQHQQQQQQHQQQPMDPYVPFTTTSPMGMEPMMAQVGPFQAELLTINDIPHLDKDLIVMPSCEVQQLDPNHVKVSSPGSSIQSDAGAGLRLKSPPPPANLATRRNKGAPTLLNSAAFRSGTAGPKTALDLGGGAMGKRVDGPAASIRRISSATGLASSRIQKHSLPMAPRSPLFFERNKGALLHSLQSSTTAGSSGGAPLGRSLSNESPGTPRNEAILGGAHAQGGVADGVVAPGSAEDLLPLQGEQQSAWSTYASNNDDSLLTPGLGSFGSDEYAMLPAAPGYIINSSQPPTPSIAQAPGQQHFFPLHMPVGASGQAEYTFPGDPSYFVPGSSMKLSPSLSKSKQFQFTPNITPQDYTVDR